MSIFFSSPLVIRKHKLSILWRLQRLTNSNQDETKRILGVSRQTSGWDYFTGRLQG